MELLEQLEQRVLALLNQLDVLKEENARLKHEQAQALDELVQENATLQTRLLAEQERNSTALARIDALTQRIKERLEQA